MSGFLDGEVFSTLNYRQACWLSAVDAAQSGHWQVDFVDEMKKESRIWSGTVSKARQLDISVVYAGDMNMSSGVEYIRDVCLSVLICLIRMQN
jgi:hypothetical protein